MLTKNGKDCVIGLFQNSVQQATETISEHKYALSDLAKLDEKTNLGLKLLKPRNPNAARGVSYELLLINKTDLVIRREWISKSQLLVFIPEKLIYKIFDEQSGACIYDIDKSDLNDLHDVIVRCTSSLDSTYYSPMPDAIRQAIKENGCVFDKDNRLVYNKCLDTNNTHKSFARFAGLKPNETTLERFFNKLPFSNIGTDIINSDLIYAKHLVDSEYVNRWSKRYETYNKDYVYRFNNFDFGLSSLKVRQAFCMYIKNPAILQFKELQNFNYISMSDFLSRVGNTTTITIQDISIALRVLSDVMNMSKVAKKESKTQDIDISRNLDTRAYCQIASVVFVYALTGSAFRYYHVPTIVEQTQKPIKDINILRSLIKNLIDLYSYFLARNEALKKRYHLTDYSLSYITIEQLFPAVLSFKYYGIQIDAFKKYVDYLTNIECIRDFDILHYIDMIGNAAELNNGSVRDKYPANFMTWENKVNMLYKEHKEFIRCKRKFVYSALIETLEHKDENNVDNGYKYELILPRTYGDILSEGSNMHNCVGGYADGVYSGTRLVLFLRLKDKPEKSFGTVELTWSNKDDLSTYTMSQCKAFSNMRLPVDALSYLCKYIKLKKLNCITEWYAALAIRNGDIERYDKEEEQKAIEAKSAAAKVKKDNLEHSPNS